MRWINVSLLVTGALVAAVFISSFVTFTRPSFGEVEKPAQLISIGPFNGLDPSKLPARSRRILEAVARDFELVRHGREPACEVVKFSVFSDGGTAIYECKEYSVIAKKTLASVGNVAGILYGPVITFRSGAEISDVRFYTYEELEQLLHAKDGL